MVNEGQEVKLIQKGKGLNVLGHPDMSFCSVGAIGLELPDAAGFCLRAPFAQESQGLASVFLLPEFSELLLEQVGTLQRLVRARLRSRRLAASFSRLSRRWKSSQRSPLIASLAL